MYSVKMVKVRVGCCSLTTVIKAFMSVMALKGAIGFWLVVWRCTIIRCCVVKLIYVFGRYILFVPCVLSEEHTYNFIDFAIPFLITTQKYVILQKCDCEEDRPSHIYILAILL